MKIRLICCSSYQVGPDSWNLAYKTFDVPVPDSAVQSDDKDRDWLHNIVGAELIEGESENERVKQ
jgi:hypothetical protein